MSLSCYKRQGGAALVLALLVVALVAGLATASQRDFMLRLRRVENQLQQQQAFAWLLGAEAVARQALLEDLRRGAALDGPTDLWARPLEIPLPAGVLRGCLRDLQGRLNLNALDGDPDAPTPDQRRFIRLLQVLDLQDPLDPPAATALANAVFDWRDGDSRARLPGGAEDLAYLADDPPGKAANRPFASVSELRLVRGMSEEIYQALAPHVTVWGDGALNLNGMDAAAAFDPAAAPVLLRTLNTAAEPGPLSEAAARLIMERRHRLGALPDLGLFGEPPLARLDFELDGLALASQTFLLRAQLQSGGRRYNLESVLRRQADPTGLPRIHVLARSRHSSALPLEESCVHQASR